MKIRRGLKRIGAVALAAILVVGSVNLSGIVVNADNEGSGNPSINPYYNNTTYVYNGSDVIRNITTETVGDYYNGVFDSNGDFLKNPYDVFGAATHVHLFAENTIESYVHTHGNIFCNTANLGEVGTRVQNNALINNIPGYREESYISGKITAINGSSDFDTLILGKDIGLELQDNGHRRAVEVRPESSSNYYVKLDNTDPRYIFKESGSTAINFANEFAYLRYLSSKWAGMDNSASVNYSSSDSNGKITISGWDGETNLYYNMSYTKWIENSNGITITGMDTTQTKRGILVINIDMNGAPVGEDGSTSITLGGNPTVGTFSNKEYKTDQYGQCRIVYNIVDTSAQNNQYTGNLQFGNTVFGSILAPSANITVGAVNGTVMARSITHEGQESHRMDIWALSTETDGKEMPSTTPNTDGENGEDLALEDIEVSFGPIDNNNSTDNPVINKPTQNSGGINITIHKTYNGTLPSDVNVEDTKFELYTSFDNAKSGSGAITTMVGAKRVGTYPYALVEFKDIPALSYDTLSKMQNNEVIYYIKEVAPSDGYKLDTTIYACKITRTKENSISFTCGTCDENGAYVERWGSYIVCDNKTTTTTQPTTPDKGEGGGEGGTTTPSTPTTPDSSNTPSTPSTPTTPSTPNTPSTPSTPTTPSTPNTPSTPSTPSTPTTPNTTTTPSTPSTPSTPTTTPGTPSTPNTWETPDGKVHFEILIEYEHIDSSSTPERIEELTTNTTIKITDKDGNDVTENVTKITWDPSRDVAVVTVEVPKPSEGFDTYYVVEDTDPADNDLSHSEPDKGFTVAVTSDGKVLFQEDGSATPTTELRFVNVEGATDTITNTMTSMTSPQTGEKKLPWTVLGGGMSMIFIAGVVYVFKKKEKIEE